MQSSERNQQLLLLYLCVPTGMCTVRPQHQHSCKKQVAACHCCDSKQFM